MILVTGGAGYIGSVLTAELVKRNYQVRVFDSLIFGAKSLEKIKDKIEIVKGDIRHPPKNIFKNIEVVIHLAAISNDQTADFDPQSCYQINTSATIKLAKLAKKKSVERFIFGSSCSIYDQGLKGKHFIQDETSLVNPVASYSLSKYQAEQKILPLANDKFTVVVVRKGTVFGYSPRMRFDLVINTMVKNAFQKGKIIVLASGKQWRPFISVSDVCRGYLNLLTASTKSVNREIFNFVTYNYQIIEIAKIVKRILQPRVKVQLDVKRKLVETRSYKVSNQKIRKILKFPASNLEKEIKMLAKILEKQQISDFDDPNYYNIEWMKLQYQRKKYL